jgi:predicted nucleic acid-binding protein
MSVFLVDASAALAWCFEDEANSWTDSLLKRLADGDRIVVPAHWPTEILKGLVVAVRRNRIKPHQPSILWEQIAQLPIEVDPAPTTDQAKSILALSERHGLTAYDAAYLELARRRSLPMGTLDSDIRDAAHAEGVPLL